MQPPWTPEGPAVSFCVGTCLQQTSSCVLHTADGLADKPGPAEHRRCSGRARWGSIRLYLRHQRRPRLSQTCVRCLRHSLHTLKRHLRPSCFALNFGGHKSLPQQPLACLSSGHLLSAKDASVIWSQTLNTRSELSCSRALCRTLLRAGRSISHAGDESKMSALLSWAWLPRIGHIMCGRHLLLTFLEACRVSHFRLKAFRERWRGKALHGGSLGKNGARHAASQESNACRPKKDNF